MLKSSFQITGTCGLKRPEGVSRSVVTLRDPMDCRPPGSVRGILQARTMEGVAISFSRLTPFLREPQLLVEGGQQQGSTPGTWRPGAQAPKNRPQPLHHPEGTQRGTVHFRWGAPSDCRPTSSSAEPGAAMNIRAPVQGGCPVRLPGGGSLSEGPGG